MTFTVSSRTPEIATKINNDIYAEFARVLDGVTKTNVLLLPMDYHSDPTVHHYWLTAKLIAMAFVLLLAAFFCKESSYYETIKDPADIKAAVDLPTLGLVTFRKDGVNLLKRGRQSEFADRYEILSYYAYSRCKGLRSILITSTGPEEGNSTVALNLATAVAWSGRKVVLLDGNCRRPSLHRLFHVSRTAGLADYLRSDVKLESIIVKTECAALDFIPAGGSGPDSGLIASRKCFELVRELEKHYDLVVIDSPPALSFPEPLLIAPLTQGCLLVVESGKTGATALCRTVENLRAANANVLGVVVNKLRFRLFGRAELESLDYYGQNRKPQETEEGTQRKRKA